MMRNLMKRVLVPVERVFGVWSQTLTAHFGHGRWFDQIGQVK
jgi:ABC-type sulfate transport system substrate-binding protein